MIDYNLTAEFAGPFLILIIIVAFLNDIDEKNIISMCLKALYIVTLTTCLVFLVSIYVGSPSSGNINVLHIRIMNTLYLLTTPLPSCVYLILCILMTARNLEKSILVKKIVPYLIPYIIYCIFVLVNGANGVIFSIDETMGYVRGDLYLLPFSSVGIHVFMIAYVVYKNRKFLHKEIFIVVMINMTLASSLMVLQALNSHLIFTAVGNIASILALHLYAQSKKSFTSQLTGAKNKMALHHLIESYTKKNVYFTIYIISIRDFKSINERNGIPFGDKVLKTAYNNILTYFNYESIFSYSGDEFAVLLLEKPENDQKVKDCIENLEQPFEIDNIDTVSLDLVCAKIDNRYSGTTIKELTSAIDYSLMILKQTHGEPRFLYDVNVVEQITRKENMIMQIKKAIEHKKLKIQYQPIYSTEKQCFNQAEALVRMLDEDGELIQPSEFIEIAETTGLVLPLTYVVLDIVCEDFRNLLDRFGNDLALDSISVNVPYHIFLSGDSDEQIMEILMRHNISPERLKIEITERTLISDSKFMLQTMIEMQKKGFIFELDDFGVDYSNMSTLLDLPLDIIKIDRNVLLSAFKEPANKVFFQHLVSGINDTKRVTIIEGIEEREQLDFILECGCEYIQGYIFSKPLHLQEFSEFILPTAQADLLRTFDLVT